jgi:hypothetical protein
MITLLTDFGTRDHFVAAMKGVIASIAPLIPVQDATHSVPPFQIPTAAFLLDQYWRYYPAGTVHVAVVDPGVGSERLALALLHQGQSFVGPDNGIFTPILKAGALARRIDNHSLFQQPVSQTFHGRDIFAPVAAHLALGFDWKALGPLLPTPILLSDSPNAILHIDHYGNAITSLRAPLLENRSFRFTIANHTVTNLISAYAHCPANSLALIAGSAGYYELILPNASAAAHLSLQTGDPFTIDFS